MRQFPVVGLYAALRRRIASAPLLAAWMAVFPLVYYVVEFETRYRSPMLWVTWLLAAVTTHPKDYFAPIARVTGTGGPEKRPRG